MNLIMKNLRQSYGAPTSWDTHRVNKWQHSSALERAGPRHQDFFFNFFIRDLGIGFFLS